MICYKYSRRVHGQSRRSPSAICLGLWFWLLGVQGNNVGELAYSHAGELISQLSGNLMKCWRNEKAQPAKCWPHKLDDPQTHMKEGGEPAPQGYPLSPGCRLVVRQLRESGDTGVQGHTEVGGGVSNVLFLFLTDTRYI